MIIQKPVKFAIGERVRIMYTNSEKPFATVCGVIARPWMIWGHPEALKSEVDKWSSYLGVSAQILADEFCYMLYFDEPRIPFSKKELSEFNPHMTDYERQETMDIHKTQLIICTERDLEHASNIIPDAI